MKPNSKLTAVKKTTARKKVLDAHEQLDAQSKMNQEEYSQKVAIKAYEREPNNPMILNNLNLLNSSYTYIRRAPE